MNKFYVSTKIYSGPNSLDVLGRFHGKRVWVVCDSFIAKSPAIGRLTRQLEPHNLVQIYSDITPDPSIGLVVRGIGQFLDFRPQLVIGFGGGSAIDAAKAGVKAVHIVDGRVPHAMLLEILTDQAYGTMIRSE